MLIGAISVISLLVIGFGFLIFYPIIKQLFEKRNFEKSEWIFCIASKYISPKDNDFKFPYWNLKFKIYLDDNGQQLCLLLDNNLIGGGAYTSNIEDCGFLYYIDLYLDNKYWNEHKYM